MADESLPDGCVRIPSTIARLRGIGSAAKSKLGGAKSALMNVGDAFTKPIENPELVKPLYDLQNDYHAIENENNAILGKLNSVRDKIKESGHKAAVNFYRKSLQAVKDEGGGIADERAPINDMDAMVQSTRLAKQAALMRFQKAGLDSGFLSSKINPSYKALNHTYDELTSNRMARNRETGKLEPATTQLSVPQKYHGIAEQIFSANKQSEHSKLTRMALATKNWSTAAIMYTPAFHIQNIGSRFIPMLIRNPLRTGETYRAFVAAGKDLDNPERMGELGRHGWTSVAPRGWNENFTGLTQKFLENKGIPGKIGAGIIHAYANALHKAVNYMGLVTYHIALQDFLKDGHPLTIAEQLAGHKASIMAGTIARDTMSKGYREVADATLFSNRYSTTTWRIFSRAVQKDAAMKNRLEMMGFTPEEVNKALIANRRNFQLMLAKEIAGVQAFGNALNYAMTGYYNLPDKNGKKGAHPIWMNPGSTWYDDIVNVKAVVGVDKQTGRPIMMGLPFRSLRDIEEIVLAIPAMITGSPGEQSNLMVNKLNQYWKIAFDLVPGLDWRHITLKQPTAGETTASVIGDAVNNLSPLQLRQAMIESVSLLYGGDSVYKSVAKTWVDQWSDMDIKKMWIRALGGQLSLGEQPGQPFKESSDAKNRFESWISQPAIRQALISGDPHITHLYYKYGMIPRQMTGHGENMIGLRTMLQTMRRNAAMQKAQAQQAQP